MIGNSSLVWRVILVFWLPCWCLSQTPETLLQIIENDGSKELRQRQIDSFLLVNNHDLSLNRIADCYHDIGLRWYYNNWLNSNENSDLREAIGITTKSLQLKKSLEQLEDCSLNKTLYNLGHFLVKGNHIDKAIEIYKDIVENGKTYCVNPTAQKDDKIFMSGLCLGELYLQTGDYYKAIEVYENLISALDAKDVMFSRDFEVVISSHLEVANVYFQLNPEGYFQKIGEHLEMAVKILAISGIACCEFQIRINQQYGNVFLTVKNYEQALKYNKEALSFLNPKDSIDLAIVNNSIGISQMNLNKNSLAQETFREAIMLAVDYADPHNNLGDFYTKKKDFKKAIQHYQKAINLKIGADKPYSPNDTPNIEDLAFVADKIPLLNHIVTKANGWIKYYEDDNNKEHLTRALETFTLADSLVDLIRFESTEQQSKLYWREQGASLYMKAVEVCHLLNKPQVAFHFMERNKALLLLEDLTNEEAKEIVQLPNEVAEREFNLKRAIFLAENDLQEANKENNKIIANLKDSIRENKYRYEQFVDSLNESYPNYAKFKNKAAVLEFKDLKTNYVSGDKAVLHYILNEEQGYGLLTLPDTTLLFQMNDIPKLNKDVETLIATLSDGVSNIDTFRKVSNSVSGQLLPENIYRKIKEKQLLIIPDYTLQRIPFEALVVNKTEPKYLIEDTEIGYAYSMSLLDHTRGKEKNAPNDLVAFAPVQFDGMGLPQLYFSENEITGIADVYPGETMINGQATKANFLENVDGHKIVHLATHADIGDGENPWIAFSDSKMYLKEIYATRNHADMVVLSACNTSNGELKRGEGVMSLARGFFYSGAKSVVSTLWPVADETGKDILIDFYKNLNRGDSKSKALQKAKLDYLGNVAEEELKHPFYWAGFVVVGDNAPMSDGPYGYWILLAVGLAVAVFLIFRHRLFKRIQ